MSRLSNGEGESETISAVKPGSAEIVREMKDGNWKMDGLSVGKCHPLRRDDPQRLSEADMSTLQSYFGPHVKGGRGARW